MSTEFEKEIDAQMEGGIKPSLPPVESATPKDPFEAQVDHEMAVEEHGSLPQQVLTGVEGAARGALGPIATAGERVLHEAGVPGLSPEEQALRQEANPWTAGLTELGGFVAGPQAKVLGAAAKALTPALGAGTAAKIGSKAINGFIDFGLFQSGNELSKVINGDPSQSVETAITDVGLMGALGGALSGGPSVLSTLWKGTVGKRNAGILRAISNKFGGIEGVAETPMQEVISKTGMELDSIIEGGLHEDRAVSDLFHILNQTDNLSGLHVQAKAKEFHNKAAETLAETLEQKVENIPEKFDAYSAGNKIGKLASKETQAVIDPLVKNYEKIKTEFGDTPLVGDITTQVPETINNPYRPPEFNTAPGVINKATDDLLKLAQKEGWTASPSSESMALVNRVVKELPLQKTINDLGNLIKSVNAEVEKNPTNGTFNRTAGMIAHSLQEAEGFGLELHAHEMLPKNTQTKLFKESSDKVELLKLARSEYAKAAALMQPLMDRLGLEGSISGFPKRLARMAQDDGEGILKKLSGKNDAAILDHIEKAAIELPDKSLQRIFPELEQGLRQAYVEEILSKAIFNGELSPYRITKALNSLSPQLKKFITQGNEEKINAISHILDKFKNPRHNFSNTARTSANLNKFLPGTLTAFATALMGHGAGTAILTGIGVQGLKEAPDAARLALLKWLGSNKPIDSAAFKGMLDFINKTNKGLKLLEGASKNVFEGSAHILPAHALADKDKIEALDKKLQELEFMPDAYEKMGGSTGYYLPNHGIAIPGVASNVVNYLNSIRPRPQKLGPLDPEMQPTKQQKAEFERVLKIAQQPLMVLEFLKENTLTTQDVNHLKAMYPAFYTRLNHQIMDDLTDYLASDKTLPYTSRFQLSMLLGQPLDSSLNPQNVMANQQVFMKNAQEQARKDAAVQPKQSGLLKMKPSSRLSLTPSDSGK